MTSQSGRDSEPGQQLTVHTREKRRLPAPEYALEKQQREIGLKPHEVAWQRYLIPGTEVLRNKLGTTPDSYGISDKTTLELVETRFAGSRLIELQTTPPTEITSLPFGLERMRAIHRHIFQDVYDWAGEIRTVDMAKRYRGDIQTYRGEYAIEDDWSKIERRFVTLDNLRGLTEQDFVKEVAQVWGRVNHAHAFREGNTRSQMLFFQQVAEQAGWSLDVERFSPKHPTSLREEFIAARFYFQEGARTTGHGDSSLLRIVLAKAIAPLPDNAAEASVEAARDPVVTATKDPAALERLKRQIRARAAELEKTDLTQDETGYGL